MTLWSTDTYCPKYPCQLCSKAVRGEGMGQRTMKCDSCRDGSEHANSYRISCIASFTSIYAGLVESSISWICVRCAIPNFLSSFFSADSPHIFLRHAKSAQHRTLKHNTSPLEPKALDTPTFHSPMRAPHFTPSQITPLGQEIMLTIHFPPHLPTHPSSTRSPFRLLSAISLSFPFHCIISCFT